MGIIITTLYQHLNSLSKNNITIFLEVEIKLYAKVTPTFKLKHISGFGKIRYNAVEFDNK